MSKVWVEAALNGAWGRDRQPAIPVSVDEIVADGIASARAGPAVARGGHIRTGLEDVPWGADTTNRALIEEAVSLVRAAGGEPATPDEVRAALKTTDAASMRSGGAQAKTGS